MTEDVIFVVHGIKKAVYEFQGQNGQQVNLNNLEIFVTKSFSSNENEKGALGQKVDVFKIADASNFILYKDWNFPCQARFVFDWDFSGKQPRAVLKKMEQL